jgi:hypothetical protein
MFGWIKRLFTGKRDRIEQERLAARDRYRDSARRVSSVQRTTSATKVGKSHGSVHNVPRTEQGSRDDSSLSIMSPLHPLSPMHSSSYDSGPSHDSGSSSSDCGSSSSSSSDSGGSCGSD